MNNSNNQDADTDSNTTRTDNGADTVPDTCAGLREQFDDKCVLQALSKANDTDCENLLATYFLDEDTGRVYRVL